eukprot:CAMPEP_0114480628 /NCGR_PEP_ID=MMETSP0104-20121206/17237_1 /TAXON_ID=37642 ORGANISM="Paraphysomonas imperforata, Strain PA2" /NCGR_SAMPLE_ID=MMETSP0104 /ASSEMBLY_ACC=CAM_ASM_000202 /LENGTH=68 /DNA_ID=CAMNT_0001656133 /DNA_START=487 /DNA_END=693 /DNA_ORIENTATION=-
MSGRLMNTTASVNVSSSTDTLTHSWSPASVKPPSSQISSCVSPDIMLITSEDRFCTPSQVVGVGLVQE